MHTQPKPRRQAFLAVALALTSSILFFSLLVSAQSSNSPETVAPSTCGYGFGISVSPTLPTAHDLIQVTVGSEWPEGCVPVTVSHQMADNVIRVDAVAEFNPLSACTAVVLPWHLAEELGGLSSGFYTIDGYVTDRFGITSFCGTRALTVLDAPAVVLSEIAWMGTTASTYDEWIELYNNSASAIDLTGWTLSAADSRPSISLNGTIPAHGYYLLERTDNDSVPGVPADQIYTGELENSGEDLVLRDATSTVVDRVDSSAGWFAGHADARVPMVRVDTLADGSLESNWTHNPRCGTPTNSVGIAHTCTLTVTNVGHALDYAVYFNERAITATTTTTATTPMEDALLDLINGADTSIDVALYGLNRQSVIDALIAAHNGGVTVRVVGDDEAATVDYPESYQALVDAGITVITDTNLSKIQHNKFLIIDGEVVWTVSTNFTDTGLTLNANNSIVITDTTLAATYGAEFAEMWTGSFHEAKTDNTVHHLEYDGTLVESYFSPTDLVAFEVWNELFKADETIHFAMFFWTDDLLTDRVVERLNAGVEVYGVWDHLGAANADSDDEALIAAGAHIRIEDFPGQVHHKFAVIDVEGSDPTVILGSYDWMEAGAYDNDENTLIVHDQELARAYYAEWRRLWYALGEEVYLPVVVNNWTPAPTNGCLDSGGTVTTGMCCLSVGDFPNLCAVGACACAPQQNHEVQICDCGPGRCFDGTACVPAD